MSRKLANAILLTLEGAMFLTLALIDWTSAKANVSERGYLIPSSVAREFHAAIRAAWRGQSSRPSLLACTHWNRNACGPAPGDQYKRSPDRPPYGASLDFPAAGLGALCANFLLECAGQGFPQSVIGA